MGVRRKGNMKRVVLLCLCATLAACSVKKLATFDDAAGTTLSWRYQGDPVMGGASTGTFAIDSSSKVGVSNGTVAIIPFLKAPGVIAALSTGQVADVSEFINGSLQMRVKSDIPYNNWKMSFGAPNVPHKRLYQTGAFKADVKIEGSQWQTVSVPFSSFSWDWSTYTGECSTTDPDGVTHQCCDKDHPEACPTTKFLSSINSLQVWAEGAVGNIHLEIESFSVNTEHLVSVVEAQPLSGNTGLPKEFDTCNNAVQNNLRYNMSTFTQGQYFPNESLAVSVCCDKRMETLAEPQFLYESPTVQLFTVLNKTTGVTTFYDSACGVPVFRAPINRTMADFEADTKEHGWPSFRDGEVFTENVVTHKDTGYVISSCNTHLGSYLPDKVGVPRWCIDLSCISGSPSF